MFKSIFKYLAKIAGKNNNLTPKGVVMDQMNEARPLPIGATEFETWAARIISGTLLPAQSADSQRFALADMLMHLKPTQDHECDAYFIKSLRKFAVNEVAHAKMKEIRDAAKARLAAEEQKTGEATAQNGVANEVLAK